MSDEKILPFPPPPSDRRKPENAITRKEIEAAQHSGDPIKHWISLADALMKKKE